MNVPIDHIWIITATVNKLTEIVLHLIKQTEYVFPVIMTTFWRMEHVNIQIKLSLLILCVKISILQAKNAFNALTEAIKISKKFVQK